MGEPGASLSRIKSNPGINKPHVHNAPSKKNKILEQTDYEEAEFSFMAGAIFDFTNLTTYLLNSTQLAIA